MAHEPGKGCKAYFNTGTFGTPIFTAVEGPLTSTFNFSMSPIETTDKDDSNFYTGIPGIRNWSISGTAREDSGSSAQDDFIDDAIVAAQLVTKVEWKTVNSNKFAGSCMQSEFSMEAGHDGVIMFTYTLTGTGAVTYAAA